MSKNSFLGVVFFAAALHLSSCSSVTRGGDFSFNLNPTVIQKAEQHGAEVPQNHFEYEIFVPETKTKQPQRFILALHGAGEDKSAYLLKWKGAAAKYQTIVVAPQLEWPVPLTTEYLNHFIEFIDYLSLSYPIDSQRVYVAGASAGGAVGLHLAVDYPDRIHGAIMISSLGFDQCLRTESKLEKIKNYKKLPPLLFVHGMKDAHLFETVLTGLEYLIDQDSPAELQSYEDAGHEHRPEWNDKIFGWVERVENNSQVNGKKA